LCMLLANGCSRHLCKETLQCFKKWFCFDCTLDLQDKCAA